jgi:biotin carboxyl carrier protein
MELKPKKLVAVSENRNEYKFAIISDSQYHIKENKYLFSLLQENDGFVELTVNGKTFTVELVSHKQNTCDVLVNGVSYSFAIETPFSIIRKKLIAKQSPSSKFETVKAPMPGKILDIMVHVGQTVNKGDTLLILEAMKMQNSIVALHKGIVTSLNFKQGDSVGKNDTLLEIEKEDLGKESRKKK